MTLHRMALDHHGGLDGVCDAATLESAVMNPCRVWRYRQGDIFDVASAYAFHLAQAQAFMDGNKRTGIAAALVFLEGNGLSMPQATDELYASKTSAICTAFSAAPFNNWSPATQKLRPLSKAQSSRRRPAAQLSFPDTASGNGYWD